MTNSLIGGPIAVIDVETTGLFPLRHDRVVEVAAVVVRVDGQMEREFVSLVNPERDVGKTSIHGITSEDVLDAPRFEEIAGSLLDVLDGAVAIAAHNVRFDRQFLEVEFSRLGCELPECFSICTMQLSGGGNLADCCRDHGVSGPGDAHQALADARAAGRLLVCLLADEPRTAQRLSHLTPIRWPNVPAERKQPVSRDESRSRQKEPHTFVQRLLRRRGDHALPDATDGAVMAYGALLDRALEDRVVDDSEGDGLVEMATRWGLGEDQIERVHCDYLNQLVIAALADGTVTDAERRDLQTVARLLGQGERKWNEILNEGAAMLSETHRKPTPCVATGASLSGMRVCFTGELQCRLAGQPISRELAEELATKAGLVVADAVTKSCDLLVLADPHSQSGKAKKARRYDVRIMHEIAFWRAIGVHL